MPDSGFSFGVAVSRIRNVDYSGRLVACCVVGGSCNRERRETMKSILQFFKVSPRIVIVSSFLILWVRLAYVGDIQHECRSTCAGMALSTLISVAVRALQSGAGAVNTTGFRSLVLLFLGAFLVVCGIDHTTARVSCIMVGILLCLIAGHYNEGNESAA